MTENQSHAHRFADALQRFEQDGDVDRFVREAFTDDAELLRPELVHQSSGHQSAEDFWRQYRDQFQSIRSDFSRVSQNGDLGVLEWRSSGTRTTGDDIAYAGVSLLDFAHDGRVQRFATYYDTAAFTGGSSQSGSTRSI